MFDKLVESTSTGADLKPRRRIFAATLVLVTALFATAVVASIYAADFDLGTSNFDIAELLTPVTETEPPREPEPARPNEQRSANVDAPTRRVLMASTEDYTRVPPTTSADVNPYRSISADKYRIVRIGPGDIDPIGYTGPTGGGTGSGNPEYSPMDPGETAPVPPPAVKKPEKKPPTPSLGVINGRAADLPHPPYPAPAKAVGASGPVNVQVTIDERGNVISAKAVSGHIMLRRVSEEAARRARFTPTLLSNVPVKVTGVIVYNFKKN